MKLFVLISLAALLIARSQSVFFAQQNQPCNKDRNILLAEDPTGNANAFLRCNGVGVGSIGFWERKFCPSNMQFDFINQQCKLYSGATFSNLKTATQAPASSANAFNIAILNNSCAKGERCIGGTVCDLETLKCLCPYGTVAQLDTLSCVRSDQNPYSPPETPKPTPAFFGPVTNYKTGANFNHNNNAYKGGFNQGLQQSSYNYMNTNGGFQKPYVVPAPPVSSVFLPEAQPIQPVNALGEVAPGQSCRNGEKCGGGAVCTFPMQLCLCPGELEEHGGQCVVPPGHQPATTAAPIPEKVGIGALCNQFAECDYQSTCVNGRCQCVEPMVESDGRCVLKLVPKEVGPGELCDSGEICTKGSVCDPTIPVCVCPEGTDLMDGYCVKIATTQAATVPPQPTTYETFEVVNTQAPFFPPATSEETYPVLFSTAAPTFPPTLPPTLIQTTPPPATKKPNHMKLQLGGGKQSGVGVQCRLNTDCMIGAYCNGNTSPPTCQCLSTHVNVNGRCQKVIYPGQVGCEHDLQCTTAYAGTSCIDRECVCPQGSRAIEQTCVSDTTMLTAPPGGSCSEIEECSGGSVCREGWCVCPDASMVVQRGICVQSKPTTSKAVTPVQITDLDTLSATSPSPSTPSSYHRGSLSSRKAAPGTNCGPLDECVGGASCIEGQCICPAGTHASTQSGRCEPSETSVVPQTYTPKISTYSITEYSTPAPSMVPDYGNSIEEDDCAAVGLICRGGTICVDQTCQCPKDFILHNDQCVPPRPKRPFNKRRGKSWSPGVKYARPNEPCSRGETCTGGSVCIDKKVHSALEIFSNRKTCLCPSSAPVLRENACIASDEKPLLQVRTAGPGEQCDTEVSCTDGSYCYNGLCRCQGGYISYSGRCIKLPSITGPSTTEPTTAAPTIQVGPEQPCGEGRECTGGSTCDVSTGLCQCPLGHVAMGGQCVRSQTTNSPATTSYVMAAPKPGECSDDTQCGANSNCVVGRCKCRPGYDLKDGVCALQENVEFSTSFSRPRVKGPPIRRPSGASTPPRVLSALRVATPGVGVCPPGNEPLKDDGGRLVVCNGVEPNCPPRSYCYVTGLASADYNCCKSW